MVMNRVRFSKKICQIELASFPSNFACFVLNLITNPMVTHVNSFGPLQIECTVSDTHRTEVVTKDFSLSLWVSQIRQCVNNTDSGLTDYECCGILGCSG